MEQSKGRERERRVRRGRPEGGGGREKRGRRVNWNTPTRLHGIKSKGPCPSKH
jgi:hypothetical protein